MVFLLRFLPQLRRFIRAGGDFLAALLLLLPYLLVMGNVTWVCHGCFLSYGKSMLALIGVTAGRTNGRLTPDDTGMATVDTNTATDMYPPLRSLLQWPAHGSNRPHVTALDLREGRAVPVDGRWELPLASAA